MFNWKDGLSIIVPTYKRPEGIRTALNSLMEQSLEGRRVEIIVADNDPAGSARDFVARFAQTSDIEIIYKHVPQPGVSNARNGALAAARGRFIAFLDDDMEARTGWAEALVNAAIKYKAGITFGPIIAIMPNKEDPLNPFMKPFFSRSHNTAEGLIQDYFGTGGCLLDLSLCDMPMPAFNPIHNETGGEDDALFYHLTQRGAKVAWAGKAESYEIVPASRATPNYMWTRNFAFGQGPTQEQADKGIRGIFGILKWMAIGAVQFVFYSPQYLALKIIGRPKYIHYHAKTAQALGKVLWWGGFSPKLYGTHSTAN
jgi:succinoglycan biosynthesis protein ExoM